MTRRQPGPREDSHLTIDTRVITRGMTSSASPEILAPAQAATIADANPTLRWTPFRSPEYASFEERTLSIWVADDKTNMPTFDHWVSGYGDLAQMKVEPALEPRSDWFALTAREERSFGPIRLARLSQRGVPFSVIR